MKIIVIHIALAFLLFLSSCNENEEAKSQDGESDTVKTISYDENGAGDTEDSVINKDTSIESVTANIPDTGLTKEEVIEQVKEEVEKKNRELAKEAELKGKEIESDPLFDLLPDEIPGTEKLAPDKGINFEGSLELRTVSTSYLFKGGNIQINLTDYLSEDNFSDGLIESLKKVPPQEPDYTTLRISGKDYIGLKKYHKKENKGSMFLIAVNRFIINVSYHGLPESITEVEELTKYLHFNRMRKYK